MRNPWSERQVFNTLDSFHSVKQMPFDSIHDWLEKLAATESQFLSMALIKKGYFSLVDYNAFLLDFHLQDYEAGDRPFPVKAGADKVSGKALAIALHVCIMLLVISRIAVVEECEHKDFLINIHSINEFIKADCFSPSDDYGFQKKVGVFKILQVCVEKCNFQMINSEVPLLRALC
jgi:hypothetical protein